MFAVVRDQTALKKHAGRSAGGRKNTKPVLHYSLSWALDENPSPEHMRETARSSLKALGLEEHQAVLAAHSDKDHLHVHIVVNTIHPESGMTATLKYSKEKLSRWAEAYEREHGIYCQERIRNNAMRREVSAAREQDNVAPYVPIKHAETARKEWFDRKELNARLRDLRNAVWQEMRQRGADLWDRQQGEWHRAEENTKARVHAAREHVRATYKPKWRNLYYSQKKEARYVKAISGNLFERAVYVFTNRERLGTGTRPLDRRGMISLILSADRLLKRVGVIHERERQALARQSKLDAKLVTEPLWNGHKRALAFMRDRQSAERARMRQERDAAKKSITLDDARRSLAAEQDNAPRSFAPGPDTIQRPVAQFRRAGAPPLTDAEAAAVASRAEQIKRDMDAWRQKNDKDFGREI